MDRILQALQRDDPNCKNVLFGVEASVFDYEREKGMEWKDSTRKGVLLLLEREGNPPYQIRLLGAGGVDVWKLDIAFRVILRLDLLRSEDGAATSCNVLTNDGTIWAIKTPDPQKTSDLHNRLHDIRSALRGGTSAPGGGTGTVTPSGSRPHTPQSDNTQGSAFTISNTSPNNIVSQLAGLAPRQPSASPTPTASAAGAPQTQTFPAATPSAPQQTTVVASAATSAPQQPAAQVTAPTPAAIPIGGIVSPMLMQLLQSQAPTASLPSALTAPSPAPAVTPAQPAAAASALNASGAGRGGQSVAALEQDLFNSAAAAGTTGTTPTSGDRTAPAQIPNPAAGATARANAPAAIPVPNKVLERQAADKRGCSIEGQKAMLQMELFRLILQEDMVLEKLQYIVQLVTEVSNGKRG